MYQSVQTCILEVNITRIGIKVPSLIVLPYNNAAPDLDGEAARGPGVVGGPMCG